MPTNPPTMSPATGTEPLRVAECNACRQLFVVYATEGSIACPGCSATTTVESLEIAELGVALPVESQETVSVQTAAEEPISSPAPQPVVAETDPELAEEAPQDTSRPPTVAEWLRQSEAAGTALPSDPGPEPATPKPSLSESLGWNPGGFQLDGLAESRPEEPAMTGGLAAEATLPTPDPTTASSVEDFRFDFESSPLAEQSTADETPALSSTRVADEGTVDSVSIEHNTATRTDADEEADLTALLAGATRPQPRRWAVPLSVAVGLVLVAAPAVMLTAWQSEGEIADASENRGRRLATEPLAAEPAVPEPEPKTASLLPFGEDSVDVPAMPSAEESGDQPIRDPATQPASYESPNNDVPPNPFPASGTIGSSALPGEEREREAPSVDPPAEQGADRYASMQVESEPEEFALPEDEFAAETAEEPAALAPIERTPKPIIGLVNAPLYSAEQLAEAYEQAASASKGFSEGTLDDPAQVSSMGQHYARLCYLAQVLTLLDPSEKRGGLLTAELEAADVFKRLFRGEGPRIESRKIAGPWIGWTGRPHGGVFFAGIPSELGAAGEMVQYLFQVGDSTVPVVMAERISVDRYINASAREVGVIGVVVESPREWIAGYEGDAERVVWARKTLPLREPREL